MAKQEEMFLNAAKSLFNGMDGFLSTKTVVGEPVYIGDTIILPLVNVTFGMAAGAFAGEKKNNGGGGIGGRLTPSSVIVIHDGTTRLINIASNSGLNKLLDMLPDFVDKFRKKDVVIDEEKEARKEAAAELSETITDAANLE